MNQLSLVAVLLVVGCGTAVRETQVNWAPRPMPPRHPASVELFTSGPPARPHVDVALIEAEQRSSFSTSRTADLLNGLRKRGARRGCDAIVIGGMSSRDPGITDAETWFNNRPRGRRGAHATCIVYTDDISARTEQ